MVKAQPWKGGDLQGFWKITRKVDGVRALWDGVRWLSRARKPLFNIPIPGVDDSKDVEIYLGNFRDSFRAVRTKHLTPGTPRVGREHMYSLVPIDDRLYVRRVTNPTKEMIQSWMSEACSQGFEGLVLHSLGMWLKVKPEETHDVIVTGYGIGEGKHAGRLGYLKTSKGDVGTGFTDMEREDLWNRRTELVGSLIEVSCMQMTPDGMFRHPSFVRERPDKGLED